ncbi:MAG: hypothetical protein V1702_01290 [Candidatus Woesearchaeota archaeon]
MPDLESILKNTAKVVLASPKFIAETVLSIDNLKAMKQLKSVEAVRKLEPLTMRYGGAGEARICYIASTAFRLAGNGMVAYGVLDAYRYVPHAMPLLANLSFGATFYLFGFILHKMGDECIEESKKAVKSVIERLY